MKSRTVLSAFLTLSVGFAGVSHGDTEVTPPQRAYSASAYSLESEELVYVERHLETWREGRLAEREVSYEDASGRLIAEKQVVYGSRAAAPSFEMIDYRTGLVESARVGAREVDLFSGVPEDGIRAKSVELPEQAVVDAGFDAFMREKFSEIAEGRRLEFDFAVPSAGRFFRFQLVPEGEITHLGERALRISMKPANAFLRLLVDPIELVYDSSGRLLEFRGLSNVANSEGDRYKARIVFDYSTDSEPFDQIPIAR